MADAAPATELPSPCVQRHRLLYGTACYGIYGITMAQPRGQRASRQELRCCWPVSPPRKQWLCSAKRDNAVHKSYSDYPISFYLSHPTWIPNQFDRFAAQGARSGDLSAKSDQEAERGKIECRGAKSVPCSLQPNVVACLLTSYVVRGKGQRGEGCPN